MKKGTILTLVLIALIIVGIAIADEINESFTSNIELKEVKELTITKNYINNTWIEEEYYYSEDMVLLHPNGIYDSKNISDSADKKVPQMVRHKRNITKYEIIYKESKEIEIKQYKFNDTDKGIVCGDDGYCDSIYDGNGDGKCDAGESCCELKDGIKCWEHLGNKIRGKIIK